MKNSYIAIGVIVIVVVLAFVFGKQKTQAPERTTDATEPVTSSTLADGSYRILADSSFIKWKGEYITGKSEEGTVMLKNGDIVVSSGVISEGSFVVDMNTIKDDNGTETLEKHLKSDDFFSVSQYPESTFVLKTITPSSADGAKVGRYIIGGNLTIKGIEQPISFPATIVALGDGSIKAESSFAINRTLWNIKYNSPTFFSGLGDKVIRDAVEIILDFTAVKE